MEIIVSKRISLKETPEVEVEAEKKEEKTEDQKGQDLDLLQM